MSPIASSSHKDRAFEHVASAWDEGRLRGESLRILYVHERFGSLGGAEANVVITASELAKIGHEVALLHGPATGRGEGQWGQIFPQRYAFDADAPAAALRALADFQPDVVYVHKLADLPVLEVLASQDVPVVRMVHDHDLYCLRSYKYNPLSREVCHRAMSWRCVFPCGACVAKNREGGFPLKWMSYRDKKREIAVNRTFHRMVVGSTYMRDELIQNGFDAGRIRIHAPVPRPGDATLRGNFSSRNLILYTGQIIRGKGVDVLLESLAKMQEPFECVILGEGNHRPYCEALSVKLGLGDRVKFKGFVPQEELKTYYRDCSVLAVSSVWPEPFGAVGPEVMRQGLPVVAFDAGGIKDWLIDGYNGYLIPWMDRTAFARALDKLLADKTLARRLGENGFQLVSERHDFARYIGDLESLFSDSSERRRRAARLNQTQLVAA